ncbi:MAG: hypothetical protein GY842_18720 [bacterium]|nr:hypothetical protein [bacterium]
MNLNRTLHLLAALALVLSPLSTDVWAQPYTLEITVEPDGGGAYHVDPDQETYDQGTAVSIYAVALPGYEFVGWQGDITAQESVLLLPIVANTSLTAVFQVDPDDVEQFQLSVYSEPQESGYVTRDPAGSLYGADAEVTLQAYAAEGFVFAGWSGELPDGADANEESLAVVMNSDTVIYANFEAASTVSSGADGANGSGVCGATGMVFWPMTLLGLIAIRRC